MIHRQHIFCTIGTASTHSKSGMVAYQGGVHTVGVGIVIILLCVTNITARYIILFKTKQIPGRPGRNVYLRTSEGVI